MPSMQFSSIKTSTAEDEIELARRHPPPPAHGDQRLAMMHPPPPVTSHKVHTPYWCYSAFLINCAVFVFEMYTNDWGFQPMYCPALCLGAPCFEDGSPCEANMMLGPKVEVLDQLGAKNDPKIFGDGEWWRIITCNWLHAGILHLVFNMLAVLRLGADLERVFGSWRIALLYLFSGIFGTICSIVFLPGSLSVGASASVFGLVGACWADVIVNFCARGSLKGSGILCLSFATLLNVAIGFTPLVDNFMHMGGLLAGLVVGMAVFAQKRRGKRTRAQESIVLCSALLLVVLSIAAVAALFSNDIQSVARSCGFCKHLNCIPMPWWSCCSAAVQGGCTSFEFSAPDAVTATCSLSGEADFTATCSTTSDAACVWDPSNTTAGLASRQALCQHLCVGC